MNQRRAVIWVSLGAPLLILLALLATQQRQGKDRLRCRRPLDDLSTAYGPRRAGEG